MMLRRFSGFVRLRVEGVDAYRACSVLSDADIPFWDVCSRDNFVLALSVGCRHADAVRKRLSGVGFDCTVERESGLPFLWRRLRKRRARLISLAVCAALLLSSRLFIWNIETETTAAYSESELRAALSDCGVDIGRPWLELSQDLMRNSLLLRLPELRWATVNIHGCCAQVVLREKRGAPDCIDEYERGDIIAARPGYITDVKALRGTALITGNDTVLPGQILIRGIATGRYGAQGEVYAIGEAEARTWYEWTAASPLNQNQIQKSGNKKYYWAVFCCKNRINFYKAYSICSINCDKMISEEKYALGEIPFGVIRVCAETVSTTPGKSNINTQDMARSLLRRLSSYINDGEIIQTEFSQWEDNDWLYVTMRAECREIISIYDGE